MELERELGDGFVLERELQYERLSLAGSETKEPAITKQTHLSNLSMDSTKQVVTPDSLSKTTKLQESERQTKRNLTRE
ncbi:hypothetical protein Bca4012_035391 [Brassica carinata]